MIELKSPQQLEKMRKAGWIVGEVLERLKAAALPGITTQALDDLASQTIDELGGKPAFKGYQGFPATICVSVNEEVVHGIPSVERKLKEGDIVGLDVGAVVEGYYADAAITVAIGRVTPEVRELIVVTEQALAKGIEAARSSSRLSDISYAVQETVEAHGLSVVRDFVGHGIGSRLHEPPQIPNYGKPGKGPQLQPGMVLAIEPMVNLGGPGVRILADGWTAVTLDGKWSAHFEHTIAVTDQAPEILTKCLKKKISK